MQERKFKKRMEKVYMVKEEEGFGTEGFGEGSLARGDQVLKSRQS